MNLVPFLHSKKTIALQHRAMFCIALLALPSKGSSMHVCLPLNSAAPCRLDANMAPWQEDNLRMNSMLGMLSFFDSGYGKCDMVL